MNSWIPGDHSIDYDSMGLAEMHDFSRPMIAGEISLKKLGLSQHKKNEAEMAGIARIVQKL